MNNKFGLSADDLAAIKAILETKPEIDKALIFGSRAIGNFKNGSDVDIALKGERLDFGIINQVSFLLNEESSMPYNFDVLNYRTLTNAALKAHIDRVGIEFYSAPHLLGLQASHRTQDPNKG